MIARLPPSEHHTSAISFLVNRATLLIPYRVYHYPRLVDRSNLSALQSTLINCVLTRHHDGFVRGQHIKSIVKLNYEWIASFVVQLVGEYVIEIIEAIRSDLDSLDEQVYRAFLTSNPLFYALTRQRVMSYWDCYYRHIRRDDYAAFEVLNRFDRLARPS